MSLVTLKVDRPKRAFDERSIDSATPARQPSSDSTRRRRWPTPGARARRAALANCSRNGGRARRARSGTS